MPIPYAIQAGTTAPIEVPIAGPFVYKKTTFCVYIAGDNVASSFGGPTLGVSKTTDGGVTVTYPDAVNAPGNFTSTDVSCQRVTTPTSDILYFACLPGKLPPRNMVIYTFNLITEKFGTLLDNGPIPSVGNGRYGLVLTVSASNLNICYSADTSFNVSLVSVPIAAPSWGTPTVFEPGKPLTAVTDAAGNSFFLFNAQTIGATTSTHELKFFSCTPTGGCSASTSLITVPSPVGNNYLVFLTGQSYFNEKTRTAIYGMYVNQTNTPTTPAPATDCFAIRVNVDAGPPPTFDIVLIGTPPLSDYFADVGGCAVMAQGGSTVRMQIGMGLGEDNNDQYYMESPLAALFYFLINSDGESSDSIIQILYWVSPLDGSSWGGPGILWDSSVDAAVPPPNLSDLSFVGAWPSSQAWLTAISDKLCICGTPGNSKVYEA